MRWPIVAGSVARSWSGTRRRTADAEKEGTWIRQSTLYLGDDRNTAFSYAYPFEVDDGGSGRERDAVAVDAAVSAAAVAVASHIRNA